MNATLKAVGKVIGSRWFYAAVLLCLAVAIMLYLRFGGRLLMATLALNLTTLVFCSGQMLVRMMKKPEPPPLVTQAKAVLQR